MRNLFLPATLAAALVFVAPARAQVFETGNSLLDRCNSADLYNEGSCHGYILGAVDAILTMKLACIPAGVTQGQVIEVVLAYLKSHPEGRHKEAVLHALPPLSAAYPCGKN